MASTPSESTSVLEALLVRRSRSRGPRERLQFYRAQGMEGGLWLGEPEDPFKLSSPTTIKELAIGASLAA